MPILDPAAIKSLLLPGQRLLGIDLGSKTIGIALSDNTRMIASPFKTIIRGLFRDDAAELEAILAKHQVGAVILGLPLNMDGSEGPRVQATRAFARNLLSRSDLAIGFWDERLSTAAVERGMIEGDLSRRRRKQIVDQSAAAYILQGFLDRLAWIAESSGD